MKKESIKPVVLMILDGFGIAADTKGNAITRAKTPNLDKLKKQYGYTQLEASGEAVGLPAGEDGNSEVGHLNIGAGRMVLQSLPRINLSIVDGSFFNNQAFLYAIEKVKKNDSNLHLMGLVGSGGVHAYNEHLFALIQLAKRHNVKNLYLHLFTDGRDSPPNEAMVNIRKVEEIMKSTGLGKIVTLMGRYYAMDRDMRWNRTEKAYDALTDPGVKNIETAAKAIENNYANGITDEFVEPVAIGEDSADTRIKDGDGVIFFNYRIDRPRQLTRAFVMKDFEEKGGEISAYDLYETKYYRSHLKKRITRKPFKRKIVLKDLAFVTMTEYEPGLNVKVAFPPEVVHDSLGEVVSKAGLSQLRVAESEKERFVTFYFNGGQNVVFAGEERIIIPSPKVDTYDLKPEMSTFEIGSQVIEELKKGDFNFYVVNIAAPDMVAHTGVIEATVKAIEATDRVVGAVADEVLAQDGCLLVTADHGNAEELINGHGLVDTEHSVNPVPFYVISKDKKGRLRSGVLADVAPTVLKILGIKKPADMTGTSLIE